MKVILDTSITRSVEAKAAANRFYNNSGSAARDQFGKKDDVNNPTMRVHVLNMTGLGPTLLVF
jgi:hypothetical protein